ncbi:serine hydrolase [Nakamurella endophytica]|uniref:Serine hydrolase n=1 Tax=Nakamurella endophytica TaxID=1748367 RepID=A0A917WCM3_9ACTN|nr:serine hydrolase [Nakamurella endophytica]GGL91890.1 hypothetical protein GCM10011594_09610 [Nakamurella endophytica]
MAHADRPTSAAGVGTTSRRALLIGGSAALLAGCTSATAEAVGSTGTAASSAATPTGPPAATLSTPAGSTPPSAAAASTTASGSTAATGTAAATPVVMPGLAPVGRTAQFAYSAVDIPEARITAAVGALDALIADVMQRSGVPGLSAAVVHGGKVVYAKGFGVRELGRPGKVDADTVFQLASLSKSVGSTAVCWAITRKKATWADKVTAHLPDFRLSDPAVTSMLQISDCYAHRTGLSGGAGEDLEALGFDRAQILQRLRQLPLKPFRITYEYTNFGMTIGGEAVAAAAGMSWEDLQDAALYRPLGMSRTSSRHSDFLARSNRAALHFYYDGYRFRPTYLRDPDQQSPAGGVSSSANDMARWMLLHLADGRWDGRQHIDPAALQAARNPHIPNIPGTTPAERSEFYGYGFNVEATSTGHVRWGHSGAFYVGAATAFGMLPAADVGIVVLTNGSPIGVPEAIAVTFTDLVRTGVAERDWFDHYKAIFVNTFVNRSPVAGDPPADARRPRAASAYVGTYTNSYVGDVVVSARGRTLTVTLGPKRLSAPLTPWDGDNFSWLPPGGFADPRSAVTFGGFAGGRATTMTIESLQIPELRRTS